MLKVKVNLQGSLGVLWAVTTLRAPMVDVEQNEAGNDEHDEEGDNFEGDLTLLLWRQDTTFVLVGRGGLPLRTRWCLCFCHCRNNSRLSARDLVLCDGCCRGDSCRLSDWLLG